MPTRLCWRAPSSQTPQPAADDDDDDGDDDNNGDENGGVRFHRRPLAAVGISNCLRLQNHPSNLSMRIKCAVWKLSPKTFGPWEAFLAWWFLPGPEGEERIICKNFSDQASGHKAQTLATGKDESKVQKRYSGQFLVFHQANIQLVIIC